MSKRGVSRATVDIIREDTRKGHSANYIQKHLRREHRGIRRQNLLRYVREFRGKAPKPHSYKYIPKKYLTRERRLHIELGVKRKHVAIYGRVKGESRRIEVSGTGYQLMDFLRSAVKHPPKQRFVRGDVSTIHGRSRIKLDWRKEWDARPKIAS